MPLFRLLLALLLTTPVTATQAISFSDVSEQAGTVAIGPTAASAWGDLNSDGWPDLWVSNHHGRPPALYLNNTDGTFSNLIANVESRAAGLVWPDLHGAAWADIDNDGDQDLLIITGGGAGQGESANLLYMNTGDNRLVERAVQAGLTYPLGRGRTPLWLDADGDGRLDALFMNKPRAEAPSRLFLQQPGSTQTAEGLSSAAKTTSAPAFVAQPPLQAEPASAESAAATPWWDELITWIRRWFAPPPPPASAAAEFAQLGYFSGPHDPAAFIAYGAAIQSFRGSNNQATVADPLPATNLVLDAAVADFNNDLYLDWLVARARPWARELRLGAPEELLASIGGSTKKAHSISFATQGEIVVKFHRPWIDPTDPRINESIRLFLGQEMHTLPGSIGLSPDDLSLHQPTADTGKRVGVNYSPADNRWHISNSSGPLNLIVRSTSPITELATNGFNSSDGAASAELYLASSHGLDSNRSPTQTMATKPCVNLTVADFDNDADLDVYAVCSSATHNSADLLLLNDGAGRFTETPIGSTAPGRGNQVAAADFNRDGRIDLVVTNGEGPPPFSNRGELQLLQNTTTNTNHWLQIDLQGTHSNRDAIGARVEVQTANTRQLRIQNGGMHSFSQDHQRLHFGLGTDSRIVSIEVTWPNGQVQELGPTTADQLLTITQPRAAHAAATSS